MFEKIKQKVKAATAPTNTAISPETGVLSMDELFGQTSPAQPDDTLYTLDNGEYTQVTLGIIYPVGTKFYFRGEGGTFYDSGIEIGPDSPVEQTKPKAPLAEAESLLAWLKTQPSTPENKAMRAQAGIVVDCLKGA